MVAIKPTNPTSSTWEQAAHHGSDVPATSQLAAKAFLENLDEFPMRVFGDLCWGKDSLAGKPDLLYIWYLTEGDKASLKQALQNFKALKLAPTFVTARNFPLSEHLHSLLRNFSKDLHSGKGFAVLRGLDPKA